MPNIHDAHTGETYRISTAYQQHIDDSWTQAISRLDQLHGEIGDFSCIAKQDPAETTRFRINFDHSHSLNQAGLKVFAADDTHVGWIILMFWYELSRPNNRNSLRVSEQTCYRAASLFQERLRDHAFKMTSLVKWLERNDADWQYATSDIDGFLQYNEIIIPEPSKAAYVKLAEKFGGAA